MQLIGLGRLTRPPSGTKPSTEVGGEFATVPHCGPGKTRNVRFSWLLNRLCFAYLAISVVVLWLFADGRDAHAYWAVDLADPYGGGTTGIRDAFLYPPPAVLAVAPFKLLPWVAFHLLWLSILTACLVYMLGLRWATIAIFPALLPLAVEGAPAWPVWRSLWVGNVELIIAAALVAVFASSRHAAWPVLVFTKPTNAIALMWFVVRRDRTATVRAATTSLLAAVPTLLLARWWWDWGDIALAGTDHDYMGGPPLMLRIVLAAGVVILAARVGARLPVVLAVTVALPVMWLNSYAVALAAVGIARRTRRSDCEPGPGGTARTRVAPRDAGSESRI